MDPCLSFDLSPDCEPVSTPMEDDVFEFEYDNDFSQYLDFNPNPVDIFDCLTPPDAPSPPAGDQSIPIVNPNGKISDDIPINPKEWLITDPSGRQRAPRLFEFLILLLHKSHYASYAFYKDKARGIFEISQPEKVAYLWQQVKNRQAIHQMTYDKFARAVRWYYKDDIMTKTNARYTFQFSARTLSCIETDENNNVVIHSPVKNSTKSISHVDCSME